jgi:hypothetical protein
MKLDPKDQVQSYLVTISSPSTPFNNFRWALGSGCLSFKWHEAKMVNLHTLALRFKAPASNLKCIPGFVTATAMTKAQKQLYFPKAMLPPSLSKSNMVKQ